MPSSPPRGPMSRFVEVEIDQTVCGHKGEPGMALNVCCSLLPGHDPPHFMEPPVGSTEVGYHWYEHVPNTNYYVQRDPWENGVED